MPFPLHVVAGHTVIIVAPLVVVISLAYAWRPDLRDRLRLPLVVVSVVNAGLAIWADTLGSSLYNQLKLAAKARQPMPAVAGQHAQDGDSLAVTSLLMAIVVLVIVWRYRSPQRRAAGLGRVSQVVLTIFAVALAVLLWLTLWEAMSAVWSQHLFWKT